MGLDMCRGWGDILGVRSSSGKEPEVEMYDMGLGEQGAGVQHAWREMRQGWRQRIRPRSGGQGCQAQEL